MQLLSVSGGKLRQGGSFTIPYTLAPKRRETASLKAGVFSDLLFLTVVAARDIPYHSNTSYQSPTPLALWPQFIDGMRGDGKQVRDRFQPGLIVLIPMTQQKSK